MSTSEERERTHRELVELAKRAKTTSPDSSGGVDLAAFSSATDPDWVEHALARPRREGAEGPTTSAAPPARAMLRPDKAQPRAAPARSRQRKWFVLVGAGYVVCLAIGAIMLTRQHRRPVAHAPAAAVPQAATVAQAPTAPQPVPAPPPAGPPTEPPQPSAQAKAIHSPNSHPVGAAAARPPARTPATVGAATGKPAPGGDPLSNAILQSIRGPEERHH
jgi:hypothetical protein